MDLSYRARKAEYDAWRKGKRSYYPEDVLLWVPMDFSLTINDVADILGFSVEHIQNNVLEHLRVVDAIPSIKEGMGNNRLKKVVSKKSLEEYITTSLAVAERKTITTFKRDSDEIAKIKEILGSNASIQKMLDDAGEYLNKKFNYKKLEIEERKRKEKIKKRFIENNVNIEEYLKDKDDSVIDILDYADDTVKYVDNTEDITLFDVLVNDMYSIKELKEYWNKKHTMQVYRELDKTSYVAVKLGDSEYDTVDRSVKGDRNIRYIINRNDLKIEKGVYRIQLNHAVYSKLETVAGVMAIETEDAILMQVLDFAKENKEKYKKKKKEGVE